jgi:hypothetical protein
MAVHCNFVPLNSVQSNFDPPPDFYALKFCIPPDSYALKFVPLRLLCNQILSLFDYYVLKFWPPLDQKIKYANNIII